MQLNKFFSFLTLMLILVSSAYAQSDYVIVIHGGAGAISRSRMTDEQAEAYHTKLNEALLAGEKILRANGQAIDAVVAAIQVLEDSPLFNAGRGAVFTSEGTNELDASIMDGRTENAGAVAGVKTIKSPIEAAKLVMDKSVHVMMAREGAEKFAKDNGLEMVDNNYFHTEKRLKSLKKAQEYEKQKGKEESGIYPTQHEIRSWKMGTVGAVVLDKHGNLAAGTSTGGMTNKKWGRIGDSPVIGAGTYASNESCAVSCTGHGEYFIRNVVAYDVAALMKYKGLSVKEAAEFIVLEKLKKQKAEGGLIALDRNGNISMPYNTENMFRAFLKADGTKVIKVAED